MAKIVKLGAVLEAERVEEAVAVPGPEGEPVVIARPGDWSTFKASEAGFVFQGFLTDSEVREKHRQV
jgi:hypothetical protein